jgi:hypothetical protein
MGQFRLDALSDDGAIVFDGQRIVRSGVEHDLTRSLLTTVQGIELNEFAIDDDDFLLRDGTTDALLPF